MFQRPLWPVLLEWDSYPENTLHSAALMAATRRRAERKEDMTTRPTGSDKPYSETTAYGNGPTDSITDTTENTAITHYSVALDGREIPYTAAAGHLVTVDPSSSKPTAKIFYVSFTEDTPNTTDRPVTFFYNGGPGSSSVYVLLGSFAPMRLNTNMPSFTPAAPYTIEPNPDSLLDKSDLVFINPVGTGYSAAIAPHVKPVPGQRGRRDARLHRHVLLPDACPNCRMHRRCGRGAPHSRVRAVGVGDYGVQPVESVAGVLHPLGAWIGGPDQFSPLLGDVTERNDGGQAPVQYRHPRIVVHQVPDHPFTGVRVAPHKPGSCQKPQTGGERRTAGPDGVGYLLGGLRWRVADHQPAKHPPRDQRDAVMAGEEHRDLLHPREHLLVGVV